MPSENKRKFSSSSSDSENDSPHFQLKIRRFSNSSDITAFFNSTIGCLGIYLILPYLCDWDRIQMISVNKKTMYDKHYRSLQLDSKVYSIENLHFYLIFHRLCRITRIQVENYGFDNECYRYLFIKNETFQLNPLFLQYVTEIRSRYTPLFDSMDFLNKVSSLQRMKTLKIHNWSAALIKSIAGSKSIQKIDLTDMVIFRKFELTELCECLKENIQMLIGKTILVSCYVFTFIKTYFEQNDNIHYKLFSTVIIEATY